MSFNLIPVFILISFVFSSCTDKDDRGICYTDPTCCFDFRDKGCKLKTEDSCSNNCNVFNGMEDDCKKYPNVCRWIDSNYLCNNERENSREYYDDYCSSLGNSMKVICSACSLDHFGVNYQGAFPTCAASCDSIYQVDICYNAVSKSGKICDSADGLICRVEACSSKSPIQCVIDKSCCYDEVQRVCLEAGLCKYYDCESRTSTECNKYGTTPKLYECCDGKEGAKPQCKNLNEYGYCLGQGQRCSDFATREACSDSNHGTYTLPGITCAWDQTARKCRYNALVTDDKFSDDEPYIICPISKPVNPGTCLSVGCYLNVATSFSTSTKKDFFNFTDGVTCVPHLGQISKLACMYLNKDTEYIESTSSSISSFCNDKYGPNTEHTLITPTTAIIPYLNVSDCNSSSSVSSYFFFPKSGGDADGVALDLCWDPLPNVPLCRSSSPSAGGPCKTAGSVDCTSYKSQEACSSHEASHDGHCRVWTEGDGLTFHSCEKKGVNANTKLLIKVVSIAVPIVVVLILVMVGAALLYCFCTRRMCFENCSEEDNNRKKNKDNKKSKSRDEKNRSGKYKSRSRNGDNGGDEEPGKAFREDEMQDQRLQE